MAATTRAIGWRSFLHFLHPWIQAVIPPELSLAREVVGGNGSQNQKERNALECRKGTMLSEEPKFLPSSLSATGLHCRVRVYVHRRRVGLMNWLWAS